MGRDEYQKPHQILQSASNVSLFALSRRKVLPLHPPATNQCSFFITRAPMPFAINARRAWRTPTSPWEILKLMYHTNALDADYAGSYNFINDDIS
jgi:hypothetical protein